jgi:hypothetical protein
MPRYKPYDYDQLMMVPVSLEDQLVPGTLEYAIHELIEDWVDTSIFDVRRELCVDGCIRRGKVRKRTVPEWFVRRRVMSEGRSRVHHSSLRSHPNEILISDYERRNLPSESII